jgi:integrase
MSRHVSDAPITTRTSRARLEARSKPYFRSIDLNLCIGYIKSKAGGRWIMRAYDGGGRYHQEGIGVADDHQDADGSAVRDYGQACKLVRDRYTRRHRRRKALPEDPSGSYKVKQSVADYVQYLHDEKKSGDHVECQLNAYISVNGLDDLECDDLTKAVLTRWRNDIAKLPARRRSRAGEPPKYRTFDPKDPEQVRRRRSSANHAFTNLRSALNHSWRAEKIASDMAWRKIKPLPETNKPRLRYLELDEVERLLNAAQGAVRNFLAGGVITGARPSELERIEVRDYHDSSGKLHIAKSKNARARDIVLGDEGRAFFRQLCAGRKGTALMLVRDDGTPWNDDNYYAPTKRAASDARIDEMSYYTLRHTYASHAVMNGMPLTVLAKNLGHVDTKMVEKHYAHLSKDFITDQIRAHAPRFGVVDNGQMDSAV